MKTKNYLLQAIALVSFAVLYFGAVQEARADVSSCSSFSGIQMKRVTYYENLSPPANDLRASIDGNKPVIRLKGWLYFADGEMNKNKPVIIYNHGHSDTRNEPCRLAKYFVEQGFVVFAPLRRGHSANTPSPKPADWQPISSTGVFTDDYVKNCLISGKCSCNVCGIELPASGCKSNRYEVDYIRQQVSDVRQQINYIKDHDAINSSGKNTTGKLVNPDQIAVLGHSYGGSVIIFANAELDTQSVAISVSGAELSWGSDEPEWETELSCAMGSQKRPIYFLQPKNGRTLAPTKTLYGIAINQKYRSQAAIFPPTAWDPLKIDDDTGLPELEYKQAHENFISNADEIKGWGKSVKEFIERYPK
ncbi:MAG TPA: alpha/beta hydrolase [Pyrinomonadaceae bacterium]|jgi:pimeloyl-ACP methyl ester carboxylesterase